MAATRQGGRAGDPEPSRPDRVAIARMFREEYGRVVATLVGAFHDLDLAEEAVQEAFLVATRTWPERGVPPNPGGWITTTARRRAIDRVRRGAKRDERQAEAVRMHADADDPGARVPCTTTTSSGSSSRAATPPWPRRRRSP